MKVKVDRLIVTLIDCIERSEEGEKKEKAKEEMEKITLRYTIK